MKPEIEQAIQVLREKILAKEEEATKLKKVINGLLADENEPPLYADLTSDSSVSIGALRTDHFYGHTLAEAAKEYLDMRKARGLGSASVNDIYKALKDGGYKFDTANEDYAKNGVRISLRKNPTIFHKLPGGDYGLCLWYGVKGRNEEVQKPASKSKKRTASAKRPAERPSNAKITQNGSHDTKEANRVAVGVASSTGAITVGGLEAYVREKNRRMRDVAKHFSVDEPTITKLLEPASKVYKADRGWLKARQ